MYSLSFDNINAVAIKNSTLSANTPVLRKGSFQINNVGDTYLDMSNWGKGSVWVNGHHLGRYWNVGPQQTVYVPIEWLKKGRNEVVVFELLKPSQTILKGIDKPILDHLQKSGIKE
jgi:beta-galactosidase